MQSACAGLSWEGSAPARALQGCPGMCRDHVGAPCQVHVCGVPQVPSPPPTGNSIHVSEKRGSSTQDDKIFLDVDPEVLPATAASRNIFTVVVPCSFNGLS